MARLNQPFSLYIHIPYCIKKCPYCDFNSHVVAQIPEQQYIDALLAELDHYGNSNDWRDRHLQSIFFGGGTPSTFKPESIGKILAWVAATLPMEADCEITLEANPGTVDREHFFGYRDAGINRISLGVQSFKPALLKFLGRVHSADDARTALTTIKQAGFDNFSFDLIYANPGQTVADWEADIDEALSFNPPHLSAYNLTFEEGTPFHHEHQSGRLHSLSESDEIAMANLIVEKCKAAGLRRYEISNYARPFWHSRHNVNYWKYGDYLGLGAGAHSYLKKEGCGCHGQRWNNEKSPARYMAMIAGECQAMVEHEELNLEKSAAECLFLGLRMINGVSLAAFKKRFGKAPEEFFPKINDFIDGKLLRVTQGYLKLTKRGLLLANSIFVHFM